jgi:hypothetical protein
MRECRADERKGERQAPDQPLALTRMRPQRDRPLRGVVEPMLARVVD